MHILFLSSILTVTRSGSYPPEIQPLPATLWGPGMPVNTENYNQSQCSREDVLSKIIRESTAFRQDLIKEAAQTLPNSFAISPLAMSIGQSLADYGIIRYSQLWYQFGFGTPETECMRDTGTQALIDHLKNYQAMGLDAVNGVFISPRMALRPSMITIFVKTFRSPIRRVDFINSTDAANFLQGWYLRDTEGNTEEIAKSFDLNSATRIAIVNVVDFRGTWLKKFSPADTTVETFTTGDGVVKTMATMHMTGSFRHGTYPEASATFIELPYASDNNSNVSMSMFIIRPDESISSSEFVKHLKSITIGDMIARGQYGTITVDLPQFTVGNIIDVNPLVRATGVGAFSMGPLFLRPGADLAGIREACSFSINHFVQKVVISVYEDGTDAVTLDWMSIPPSDDAPSIRSRPLYVMIGTTGKNPINVFTARLGG